MITMVNRSSKTLTRYTIVYILAYPSKNSRKLTTYNSKEQCDKSEIYFYIISSARSPAF